MYLGKGSALVMAKKNAERYTKDDAELARLKAITYHRLSQEEITVLALDKVLNPAKNKFGAIQAYYSEVTHEIYTDEPPCEFIRFDSTIEAKVYQRLRMAFKKSQLSRQHSLLIKPKTRFYDGLYWRCDFRVMTDRSWINIEVKGLALPSFKRDIQHLQAHNPIEWERLIIVSDSVQQIDKHKSAISFAQFVRFLNNKESVFSML